MAILQGKRHSKLIYSLKVEPVMPTLDGPHHAYDVALLEGERVLFERRYRVWQYDRRFQLGHYWMYRIAHAFQQASTLMDQKLNFCLSPPFPAPSEYNQPACIKEGIDWLVVTLWGKTVKAERRFFVMILADTDTEPPTSLREFKLSHYASMTFYCSPEAAEAFGYALKVECESAKEEHKILGVLAWDDVVDDENAVNKQEPDIEIS